MGYHSCMVSWLKGSAGNRNLQRSDQVPHMYGPCATPARGALLLPLLTLHAASDGGRSPSTPPDTCAAANGRAAGGRAGGRAAVSSAARGSRRSMPSLAAVPPLRTSCGQLCIGGAPPRRPPVTPVEQCTGGAPTCVDHPGGCCWSSAARDFKHTRVVAAAAAVPVAIGYTLAPS